MNINRYPGHMDKTRRDIIESLKLVDLVGEVIDARIPISSKNPLLDEIIGDKPRIILMNKEDMADESQNQKWLENFKKEGLPALKLNSRKPIRTQKIYDLSKDILGEKFEKQREKNMDGETIKMMVVGVPNSGKSIFINNVSKKKGTKVGNKPGVTRQKQWIRTDSSLMLLDTPGILRPKFDEKTGLSLSYTGAIRDEILNIDEIALRFLENIKEAYPESLSERYGVDPKGQAIEIYEEIAKKRGAILRGGEVDYERAANIILTDFRNGKLGRITLERL